MQTDLILPVALFIFGLFIIVKGGNLFVDAAQWFSLVTGIPKIIVGATVVSVATTLPELFVSAIATYSGSVGIATGNAVGSVIANIGLGLSVSVIAFASAVSPKTFNPKAVIMIVSTAMLLVFSIDGNIALYESLLLFAMLGYFLYSNVQSARYEKREDTEDKPIIASKQIVRNIAYFAVGAAGIIFGAQLLVNNGTIIASSLGVPDTIIGLTIIAIGTSLPEIATAITAVIKKEAGISVGNIIGANVIDVALILPVCSFLSKEGLQVPKSTYTFDLPIALAFMSIAVIPVLFKKKFMRWQGYLILVMYVGYLAFITMSGQFLRFF